METDRKRQSGASPSGGRVSFELFEGLYDDYVFHAGRAYVLPAMVAMPHMGVPAEWLPSVVTLLQKYAPIVWSFWTEREYDNVRNMMVGESFNATLVGAYADEGARGQRGWEPFASQRGHLDAEQVRVLFDNRYSLAVRGFASTA